MKKNETPPKKAKETTAKATKEAKTVKSKATPKKPKEPPKKEEIDPKKAEANARRAASTRKTVQENVAERKRSFLEVFKNNMCIVASSCLKAGIPRCTYYQWRKEDAEFAAACDDIEELQKDMAEASILKQIKEGNTTMTIFYAKTKMRDRGYGEKQDINLHTPEELDFSKLSDEELLQYNELLNKMHKNESKE